MKRGARPVYSRGVPHRIARMRRRVTFALLLLPALALLTGCGQKGPLVLPPRPATPAAATSVPTAPAPAASAALPASARSR